MGRDALRDERKRRVMDALARYEKTRSRKTGTKTVDRGKGEP